MRRTKWTGLKVDLSQESILCLLRPDDNWTNRQIWIADIIRVGTDPVVILNRDGWAPHNPSAYTRQNLKKLLKAGKIGYTEYIGYYLTDSELERIGYTAESAKLKALDILRQREIVRMNQVKDDLYNWNRLVYLGWRITTSHWNHEPNSFHFLVYHGYIPRPNGESDGVYLTHVHPCNTSEKIEEIAKFGESEVQAIEIEIARVEYHQDCEIKRRIAARSIAQ